MTIANTRSRRILRRGNCRSGAEVIELALLMLPLLWLTFGAIDYGWYFYLQHNLEGAAREGARVGIIQGNSDADIQAAVDTFMKNSGFSNSADYTVSETTAASRDGLATDLTVVVKMNYQSMGIPPAKVYKTSVDAAATMRKEPF
jgi:Flp pilus assembly protein TadG